MQILKLTSSVVARGAGFLDAHPSADFFISTDCLSHRVEVEASPNEFRCGHVPGSHQNNGYNTGMLVLRKRMATLQIMREWHHRLANPTECAPPSSGHKTHIYIQKP